MPDDLRPRTAEISRANISTVACLEQRCFQTPWSPAACAAEITHGNGGGFVATCDNGETITGYIFYRMILDEMHIMKIATAPRWRKHHIATELLQKTITLAREKGLRRLCLEVRASNLPAINLYRKFEFTLSGKRPRYYDNHEDAVLMTKNILEDFLS